MICTLSNEFLSCEKVLLNGNVKVRPGYVSPAFVRGPGTGLARVRPVCSYRQRAVIISLFCVDETAMTSKVNY